MMPFVYFKFRSTIEYEKLPIETKQITVGEFKRLVIENKAISKNADVRLEVKNATTDQIYKDDNEIIIENSTLIIRRVPLYLQTGIATNKSLDVKIKDNLSNGVDNVKIISDNNTSEEERMKVIMNQNQSVIDYEHTQNELSKKIQKTGKVPICYHCKAIGHVYRTCPLLTQQSQVKRDEPTHIFLKSQLGLLPTQNTYNSNTTSSITATTTTTTTTTAVNKCNDTNIVGVGVCGSNSRSATIPDYLTCPICNNLMEKPVLTPCCGTSYCDDCIQDYLLKNEFKCFECHEHCYSDSIIPNMSLRKSVLTFIGANGAISNPQHTTSTNNTAIKSLMEPSKVVVSDPIVNNNQIVAGKSSPNLLSLNNNPNNNSFEQPVMRSLATHMLQSLISPLLSNIYNQNNIKKNWTNQRKYHHPKYDDVNSSNKMECLKHRMELFKTMESLSYTQIVLTEEQFGVLKNQLKNRISISLNKNERLDTNYNLNKRKISKLDSDPNSNRHKSLSKKFKDDYTSSNNHHRSYKYSSEKSRYRSKSPSKDKDRKRRHSHHSSRYNKEKRNHC